MIDIHVGSEFIGMLWALATLISLGPVLIFFKAYGKVRDRKLLYTTLAFLLIFVKALILTMRFLLWDFSDDGWWAFIAIIEIAVIGLITISLTRAGTGNGKR